MNLFVRQKVKLAIGAVIALAVITSLFVTMRNKNPQADSAQTPLDAPASCSVPTVEIIAKEADAAEQGQKPAKVLVKYSGFLAAGTQLQVEMALTGEATYGSNKDYTFTSGGTYSGPPDKLVVIFTNTDPKEKVVTITPVDDTQVETPDPETIKLRIIPNNTVYKVGTQKEAIVSIYDNDVPTPVARVTATDDAASEHNRDTGTFTFSLSKKAIQDTTIAYQVTGIATAGSDYTSLSGSVVVKKDTTSSTVTVTPIDDTVKDEPVETVIATIVAATGYTVSSTQKTATINIDDNDGPPIVSITPETATAGPGQVITLTLKRTGNLNTALNVRFSAIGSAFLNSNYNLSASRQTDGFFSVLIPQGQPSATFTLINTTQDDNEIISNVAVLQLSDSTEYKIGTPSRSVITLLPPEETSLLDGLKALSSLFIPQKAKAADSNTGCIYGIVTDKKTGKPLPNIRVFAQEAESTAIVEFVTTNAKGEYGVEFLLKKPHNMQFNYGVGNNENYNQVVIPNVTPTKRVDVQLTPGSGELSGALFYKNSKGIIKPLRDDPESQVTTDTISLELEDANKNFIRDITVTKDSKGNYVFKTKAALSQKTYINQDSFMFQDQSFGPYTPIKKDIKIILTPKVGKLEIKGMLTITGQSSIPPFEIPNPDYPGYPPLLVAVKPILTKKSYYFDVDARPEKQYYKTTNPTLVLNNVAAGKFNGGEVIALESDNKAYNLFIPTGGILFEEDVETGAEAFQPITLEARTKPKGTGTVYDRKLEGIEKVQKIKCDTASECSKEPFATFASILKMPPEAKFEISLIPPKIKEGKYEGYLESEVNFHYGVNDTDFEYKTRPNRSEKTFKEVEPGDGYYVRNLVPLVACVKYQIPRGLWFDRRGYVRITRLQTHVVSATFSVPDQGTAEARFNSIPDTINTFVAAIDDAFVTDLGYKGSNGQKSEDDCTAYKSEDYDILYVEDIPSEVPEVITEPTPEP